MTKIEEYKNVLSPAEKEFLEEYESSIDDLLEKLDANGLLKTDFASDEVERRQKLITTFNVPYTIYDNAYKFFESGEKEDIDAKLEKLEGLELGLKTQNADLQFLSILCHLHQVTLERLKFNLVTIIDFPSLNLKESDPLKNMLRKLDHIIQNNKFIRYFNPGTRNAIAHYTYFFDGGRIYLCNYYYEPVPDSIELADFLKETIKLNILTVALFNIFIDKIEQ